ncbi:phosphopantetheine-binding protein [Streptomyces indicus]|uniref:Phosphopantetheine attachment site n=1 Tax=Streptomyces indicus TaxID=417292 RepID=A0A1G9HN86_9ACTN|nr:phosphopantetheine-binding protein [Streptomyces indicus]SDL14352.1 Phosphopantetheine attachment site [Streptomyces indicus]
MLNDRTHNTSVEETVRREIDSVLLNDDGASSYSLDDPLLAAGLNSLLLAQLLLQLETALGIDPFAGDRSITDIRTVGELIAAYDEAIRTAPTGV